MQKKSILRIKSLADVPADSILLRIYHGNKSDTVNIWKHKPVHPDGYNAYKNFYNICQMQVEYNYAQHFSIYTIHDWCKKSYYSVYLFESEQQAAQDFPEYFI